jgi:hypothetical protein
MAMALDTLAYARRLREAGFTEQQAEGQAEALAAAMTDTLANKQDLLALATKDELANVSARLEDLRHEMEIRFERVDARFAQVEARFGQVDARIDGLARQMDLRFAELEARFDSKLADLERRMTMRLGAIMVAGIGFLSAVVRLG